MPIPSCCIHGDLAEFNPLQVADDGEEHCKRNYAHDQVCCV